MDEIASFNQSKWDELAGKGVIFSRPYMDLNPDTARQAVDPHHLLGDLTGKDVLCLASGGGQQSAAFYILGARVDVIDISEAMLARDREVAAHYGAPIGIHQGDMRDLSRFADSSFDVVWHAYSINFIPDPRPVFREVARVLRPGGMYRIEFHNPFFSGLEETHWTGSGYAISQPYVNGKDLGQGIWEFTDEQGQMHKLNGPRAFRHNLSQVTNNLASLGFVMLGLWEEIGQDQEAEPGTYDHFITVAPPWLTFWMAYHPDFMSRLPKPELP
jgi:SAM-dependent methyltransferase